MDNNKLDKYFKNKLDDAAWTPGTNVWDKIEQSGVIGERKGFILPMYAKIAAAAVLTIGLFSVALIWMNQPGGTPQFAQEETINIDQDTTQPGQSIEKDTAPASIDNTKEDGEIIEETDSKEMDSKENAQPGKQKAAPSQKTPKAIDLQRKINNKRRTPSAEEKVGVQEQRAILASQSLTPLQFDLKTNRVERRTPYEATSLALELAADPPVLEYRSTLDMFEDAGYATKERNEGSSRDDNTITEKLFQFAGEKLSTFADASGLPFQRLSRVNEIEIVY